MSEPKCPGCGAQGTKKIVSKESDGKNGEPYHILCNGI